jgi:N utilization substance protein B
VGARSKARKRAVDVLYAAALRDADPVTLLAERTEVAEQPAPNDYAETLVEGVVAHRERIDELLTAHAEGWTLDRMPFVDLAVLRLGVYEFVVGHGRSRRGRHRRGGTTRPLAVHR